MTTDRASGRLRRHERIRKIVRGTTDRPRLNVFRSNRYVYAQIIDDQSGRTIAAASSLEEGVKGSLNRQTAARVGELIAKRALEQKVRAVVFDRGGFIYHGRVKALADAARAGGLEF
ncbi:MAG: 50S ribosomal protein L18 [Nitrospirota bacterium]